MGPLSGLFALRFGGGPPVDPPSPGSSQRLGDFPGPSCISSAGPRYPGRGGFLASSTSFRCTLFLPVLASLPPGPSGRVPYELSLQFQSMWRPL